MSDPGLITRIPNLYSDDSSHLYLNGTNSDLDPLASSFAASTVNIYCYICFDTFDAFIERILMHNPLIGRVEESFAES